MKKNRLLLAAFFLIGVFSVGNLTALPGSIPPLGPDLPSGPDGNPIPLPCTPDVPC